MTSNYVLPLNQTKATQLVPYATYPYKKNPVVLCGNYHRKYHRKLPQDMSCGILGRTTGQYHTLVTTGVPQVSTTQVPQGNTAHFLWYLPQEVP